uniref:60S ribosomal protein L10P insertion domain-containing protein n=1 Tax=Corethron hystrix TaxID=216773 RepID=A0A6U5EE50_9STRA|mmetsp:Transcript_17439/g.39363  ORF Transcript_17439/g.39363 Transcript_17439/m.39363 type:complete len:135 (+) Transcript_17439:520-924(+)
MPLSPERKKEYFERMKALLTDYKKCFIVQVDNVGSKQLQDTRKALRGQAEILMGKNTMMRKVITNYVEEFPDSPVQQLIDICKGNIGFVFTNGVSTSIFGFNYTVIIQAHVYGIHENESTDNLNNHTFFISTIF